MLKVNGGEYLALTARLAEAEALLQEVLDAGIEELWMTTPDGDTYDANAALRERINAALKHP
jgi:PAS domain-containing protein